MDVAKDKDESGEISHTVRALCVSSIHYLKRHVSFALMERDYLAFFLLQYQLSHLIMT